MSIEPKLKLVELDEWFDLDHKNINDLIEELSDFLKRPAWDDAQRKSMRLVHDMDYPGMFRVGYLRMETEEEVEDAKWCRWHALNNLARDFDLGHLLPKEMPDISS